MKTLNLRPSKNVVAFLILLAAVTVSVAALVKVDFSGNWVLDQNKSVMTGREARFAATKISVVQEDAIATIIRTSAARNAEVSTTENLTLDGKEAVATGGAEGSTRKSSLRWSSDKNTWTLSASTTAEFNGNHIERTEKETWTLSADGKTLTIDDESTNQGVVSNLKLVYNKQ